MTYIPYDPIADQQGVIRRAAEHLSRRANEFFEPTEEYRVLFDANDLGVWVGIRSLRAKSLFESLRRNVFRSFEPHNYWVEDGFAWMRYGF
jgi:hypothetical protein